MTSLQLPRIEVKRLDIAVATLLWLACVLFLIVQCLAYRAFVLANSIELVDSAIWALQEWGPWLVLGPLIFGALGLGGRRALAWSRFHAAIGLGSLAAVMIYRVGLDCFMTGQNPVVSLVYFLPRHVAALLLVGLAWQALQRLRPAAEPAAVSDTATPTAQPLAPLLVSRGASETLIEIDQIDSLSAAGNYVSIYCAGEEYLLRSTLKQLEQCLPAEQFVRIHRSHIVRVRSVERIDSTASGNGIVHLRDGRNLSLSKTYRAALKKHSSAVLRAQLADPAKPA